MRGPGWAGCLLVAAACALGRSGQTGPASGPSSDPLGAGIFALRGGRPTEATTLLTEAARRYPALEDYALYFEARAAAGSGRRTEALDTMRRLLDAHPDSVWIGPARLLTGELVAAADDLPAARDWLQSARTSLPSGGDRWARAMLRLADVQLRLGDAAAAFDTARELRRARPRGLAARRARRLMARVARARPDVVVDPVDEAEMRLREGDPAGARDEAATALGTELESSLRARALWVRAQAEHALRDHAAAEATCLALAEEMSDPLAAKALVAAAGWRWNADDDQGALRLFHEALRRFPTSPPAGEALYGIGRIAQEQGHYQEAQTSYARSAELFPRAPTAADARWRTGWVLYLAGDWAGAERAFGRLTERGPAPGRIAAEYWRARSLERLSHRDDAEALLAHVVERHPTSYYATLAERELGRDTSAGTPPASEPPAVFPADLTGTHAERARVLADLGFRRFARTEIDAIDPKDVPRRRVLEAYRAIGAIGAALRAAHAAHASSHGALRDYLYPLGYWGVVQRAARVHAVDPLLVLAVIRQESLFEPAAVSSAGAQGLMQLMPATARRLARTPGRPALTDPAVNIDLGVELLARLITSYDGSVAKALAAYNGGEDAVAKWERRYAGRAPDEFVELISYRETRDYVKAVLRNYRVYRQLYAAAAASESTTSFGSPPNAPFDMITMTSPACPDPTR
ncbi:MAG TPA: transglycosylase SLT domain-containing protein [Candidatus Binatia bacterium]|nr:transglycosylase SLT domain-containing protein [Candidatus Binatia bacterium]